MRFMPRPVDDAFLRHEIAVELRDVKLVALLFVRSGAQMRAERARLVEVEQEPVAGFAGVLAVGLAEDGEHFLVHVEQLVRVVVGDHDAHSRVFGDAAKKLVHLRHLGEHRMYERMPASDACASVAAVDPHVLAGGVGHAEVERDRLVVCHSPFESGCHALPVLGVYRGPRILRDEILVFLGGASGERSHPEGLVDHLRVAVDVAVEGHAAGQRVDHVVELRLLVVLFRDVVAHGEDHAATVLVGGRAADIMHPDVAAVLLLHPIVRGILAVLRELRDDFRVHPRTVVGMHAVGDGSADALHVFPFGFEAQVREHAVVYEVEGEPRLVVAAEQAAGHGGHDQLGLLACDCDFAFFKGKVLVFLLLGICHGEVHGVELRRAALYARRGRYARAYLHALVFERDPEEGDADVLIEAAGQLVGERDPVGGGDARNLVLDVGAGLHDAVHVLVVRRADPAYVVGEDGERRVAIPFHEIRDAKPLDKLQRVVHVHTRFFHSPWFGL